MSGIQNTIGQDLVNAFPVDYKYGPYANVAAAKAAIAQILRFDGLTVKINGDGEYWWLAADLTDSGLVKKSSVALRSVNKIYYVVGTAADALLMGGAANNVYGGATAFQDAYNAAIVSPTARTTIYVGNTVGSNGSASLVGGLTLTSTLNVNIAFIGTSPAMSVVGIINGSNATGNGFQIQNIFSNITVLGIVTSATGATGNSGLAQLFLSNSVVGPINTSITNAANLTGIGGSIVVSAFGTGLPFNGGASVLTGASVTSAKGAVAAGSVTVTGVICQSFNTAISPNTGGAIVIRSCQANGSLSCDSSSIINHIVEFSNVTAGGLIKLADGASVTCLNSSLALNVLSNGAGVIQPQFIVNNSIIRSTSGIAALDQITKLIFTNSILNFIGSSTNGNTALHNIGSNSIFRGSTIQKSGTWTGTEPETVNRIGTGVQFLSSYIEGSGTTLTTLNNNSAQTVKWINSKMIGGINSSNISLNGEQEFDELISTVDATPTTIFTFPILTGQKNRVVFNVEASSGNNCAFGMRANIFKNVSGTVSKIGATDEDLINPVMDAALIGIAFSSQVSGTNLIVQVTGLIATNIDWKVTAKIYNSF